ncbi:hypothetical protein ACFL6X_08475, partial [Candidatus Latescibacterota bacterium]
MKEALNQVLEQLEEIHARYDEAGQEILRVAWHDGHFPDCKLDDLVWPRHRDGDATIGLEGLRERARLIARIFDGIPERRDHRLWDAYQRYAVALPAYHEANRLFLQVRRQFVERGAGVESDFLALYQVLYLEALGREDPVPLDEGEAALVDFRVTRAPMAHASAVAERIQTEPDDDDPRWDEEYTGDAGSGEQHRSLRDSLRWIAERVVDAISAGEHLAVRYNCFSNFVWFGISVTKVVSDIEVLVFQLRGHVRASWLHRLDNHLRLAQALLLKFLQAHSEDPAQIRPKEFWYGQEYSYLTRDMIDLTTGLIAGANRLRRRARRLDLEAVPPIDTPPLLQEPPHHFVAEQGRFLEYPHVGKSRDLTRWGRVSRITRWVGLFRNRSRRTQDLARSSLSESERREEAWKGAIAWGRGSLDLFDIEVRVTIDPGFARVAEELDLAAGGRKVVFFPTHQTRLDHPVMMHVLSSPELVAAMGWERPVPCCMLARAGLVDPCILKVGPLRVSLIGVDSKRADELMAQIDGYVIMDRSDDTSRPTADFAHTLENRPGVVYGAGTTSAFDLQVLPMQHALFAYLPQDIVLVPIACRGIHSLWPNCPRGNLHINPGIVEVVVSPPMLGETTLLPRKRALRTQL